MKCVRQANARCALRTQKTAKRLQSEIELGTVILEFGIPPDMSRSASKLGRGVMVIFVINYLEVAVCHQMVSRQIHIE